jgi:hypothetical protein
MNLKPLAMTYRRIMLEEVLSAVEAQRNALASLHYAIFSLQQREELVNTYAEQSCAYSRLINIANDIEEIIRLIFDVELTLHDEADRSIDNSESQSVSPSGSCPPSCSEELAILDWACCVCDGSNFTDPWGPDALCGCGHQYCRDGDDDDHDNDNQHCSVEWDPE